MSLTHIDFFFPMLSFNEKVISTLWKLPFQSLHLSSVLPGFPWVPSIHYPSTEKHFLAPASWQRKSSRSIFIQAKAQVLISRKIPKLPRLPKNTAELMEIFLSRPTFFLFLSLGFCFCFALFFLFLATSLIRGQSESFLLVFCKEIILF